MMRFLLVLCVVAFGALANHATAQEEASRQWRPVPSTGRDLKPEAQAIIDASNAQGVFEAAPDTRFRLVRHRDSGITCSFPLGTEAHLIVKEGARDSAACLEVQGGSMRRFDILRNRDATVDEIFKTEVRANGIRHTGASVIAKPSRRNSLQAVPCRRSRRFRIPVEGPRCSDERLPGQPWCRSQSPKRRTTGFFY